MTANQRSRDQSANRSLNRSSVSSVLDRTRPMESLEFTEDALSAKDILSRKNSPDELELQTQPTTITKSDSL